MGSERGWPGLALIIIWTHVIGHVMLCVKELLDLD